mmetsp:Transcript_21366/g.42801  ORF Transcript_21366/g.42801 Transcript_21366/m.42801 type:complete len:228 (-) Transcript_21366:2563-3246(-)
MPLFPGDQANGLFPNNSDLTRLTDCALVVGFVSTATVGALDRRIRGIQWHQLRTVHDKGSTLVVVQLVLVPRNLLALLQHLGRLDTQLRVPCRIHVGEFKQAAGEGRRHNVVFVFEGGGHGAAEREEEVGGLQVAVGEVGGELRETGGVFRLGHGGLDADGGDVLAADFEHLLDHQGLVASLRHGERDFLHNVVKSLQGIRELATLEGSVAVLERLLERPHLEHLER